MEDERQNKFKRQTWVAKKKREKPNDAFANEFISRSLLPPPCVCVQVLLLRAQ